MRAPVETLLDMKAPGAERARIWRGGVLQVKVTNACDLDCKNCSVGVGIAKKLKRQFLMKPEQFRTALRSLKGYPGVIGMFGGNPCIHPRFPELCDIFVNEVPDKTQRGLWSNNLFGHGKLCRDTFYGPHSNINVHESREAWAELERDWPEATRLRSGLSAPSMHGPVFGAMTDLGVPEAEMWERVAHCYVNQTWSAEITVVNGTLSGYFCEIAATMAELSGDDSEGVDVVPGWWRKSMREFVHQVEAYCTKCLVPLNPRKVDAKSKAPEEYTKAWAPVLMSVKGRPMKQVGSLAEIAGGEPATKYLPAGVGTFP